MKPILILLAALLRLEAADAPDFLQLLADLDSTEIIEDLLLHAAMEDQAGEVVPGFRVDERNRFGFFLPLHLSVAAARVAMVGGDGRVGRQFVEFVDG
jgi:hypothetical protein